MRARAVLLLLCALGASMAALASANARPARAAVSFSTETEPNDAAPTASPLRFGLAGGARVTGGLASGTDEDWFSFAGSTGQRVSVLIDTTASTASTDTIVELRSGPAGADLLEADDDDHIGKGALIASAALTVSGTWFVRVRPGDAAPVTPYRMTVSIQVVADLTENEPNGSSASARPLFGLGGTGIGATIGSAGDDDWYSVRLTRFDRMLITIRHEVTPGAPTHTRATVYEPGGFSVVGVPINDATGTADGFPPTAEGGVIDIPFAGTFFIKVESDSGIDTGAYRLLVQILRPFVTPGAGFVIEGDTGVKIALIPISLDVPSDSPVSANVVAVLGTASQPADITLFPNAFVTFAAGETAKQVPVGIVAGDAAIEADETVILSVTSTVGAVAGPEAALFVVDDDVASEVQRESEPNGEPASAIPIALSAGGAGRAAGAIVPIDGAADTDWWSIEVPANALLWANVDAGAGAARGNATDTFLELVGPDGTTVIESDDDDGNGNGSSPRFQAVFSSGIAGRTLANAGRYYLRVRPFLAEYRVDPYRLYVAVSTVAATNEIEPNDLSIAASALLPAAANVGVAQGTVGDAADIDGYSVFARAGETLLLGLDGSPQRIPTAYAPRLTLTAHGGAVVYENAVRQTASTSGETAARIFPILIRETGEYRVVVRTWSGAGGDYRVLAARYAVAGTRHLFAEGTVRAGFVEYLTIQNPGDVAAVARVSFQTSGSPVDPVTIDAAPKSRTTFNVTGHLADLAPIDVSLRVDSDVPVVAERPIYFRADPALGRVVDGATTVVGAADARRNFSFAEGTVRPGFVEYLTLQNPGATDALVAISVQASDDGGSKVDFTPFAIGVPKASRRTVNISHILAGKGNLNVSLGLASDQPIVAERPVYFAADPGGFGGRVDGGTTVVGAAAPARSFAFAEGTVRDGFVEFVTLQNPGKIEASVRFDWQASDDGGAAVAIDPLTLAVPPESRRTVNVSALLSGRGNLNLSMLVTSDRAITAERPIYFRADPALGRVIDGGTTVVGAAAPARSFAFAEGTVRPGFVEYLTIQNPGISAAKVVVAFQIANDRGNAIPVAPVTLDVAPGSRRTVNVSELLAGADPLNVSMVVTSDRPIVAERPIYFSADPGLGVEVDGGTVVIGAAA